MAERIYTQDTAVIEADIFGDDGTSPVDVDHVVWDLVDPSSTPLTVSTLPATGTIGQYLMLNDDQTVNTIPYHPGDVFIWNGTSWTYSGFAAGIETIDNTSTLTVPSQLTATPGLYRGRARFVLADSTVRSIPVDFEAIDPLAPIPAIDDNSIDWVIEHAHMKLEDLFDSELGGPWLQDKTIQAFNKDKMTRLLPDALYYINNESQPVTAFDDTSFPLSQHKALLAQALLVETIYHLMRSYVEQKQPVGQTISYFDRRDYLTRWATVLASEEKKLQGWIDIFKLQYTGFGSSALLVGGYASSLSRTPAAYRTRYPKFISPYRALS